MEAAFKKYFWLIRLVGVAIVVLFAGSALVNFVGTKVLLQPAGEAVVLKDDEALDEDEAEAQRLEQQQRMLEKLAGDAPTTASRKRQVADAVLAGSIFCPTCTPPEFIENAAAVPGVNAPVRPGEIKSRLPLQLLATMESDDPEYSMATILHTDSNVLAAYVPQDELRTNVVVQRVERGKVVFRNGQQLEYIELGAEPPPVAAAPAAAPEPETRERKRNSREIEGATEAIQCDSDYASCSVDKAFVEKLLANPAQLTKQARIVPAVRDGETTGYKFYGIRPGSLPKLLGLKNGDLLTSVNGQQLKSIDQAMGLYTKLRRASHLSVVIERKGQTINKEIDIK
ncbi:hypothetical protein G6O69_02625 [Pseudenhygromyxa sp. WMMC2535]|uniref:type II secretion system protein GspC n=1 Tax=Pseudenhygromyxa sp. WMMC2535 TaxID=2712867 RepID=UPI001551A68B|nr:type II secretion system protein GspC [Pseudenhygromyxa sp. WMMC2535]NVB36710.1 hypothetical protein [Pseudenhygromyxa sp. WMMC2535]